MKLELKHLAGYLPYGLNVYHTGEGKPFRGTKKIQILSVQNFELLMFSTQRKPILRPLSDLINDTFDFIYNTECDYPSIKKWIELDSESRISCKFSYNFWELLYENHFDIHGLIEKGLAIDINTLNKQNK